MDPLLTKGICMALIGFGSMFFGLITAKVAKILKWNKEACDRSPKSQKCLSVLLCFGGGVLLATAFIHMLPEVRDGLVEVMGETELFELLPWAEISVCAGFFLVYFIEEAAHRVLYSHTHHPHEHHTHEHHDEKEHMELCASGTHPHQTTFLDGDSRRKTVDTLLEHSTKPSVTAAAEPLLNKDGKPNVIPPLVAQKVSEGKLSVESSIPEMESLDVDPHNPVATHRLRSLLALLALSVHSLLEGMAVGLQKSSMDVWYLFAAIAIHKYVIAFCVGMELVTSGSSIMFHVAYVTCYSIMSPIGVAVGIILTVSMESDVQSPAVPILQGLAAGTLLYVTFFEVLQRERSKCHAGLLQFTAVLIGFCIMVAVETIGEHRISHKEHVLNHTVVP